MKRTFTTSAILLLWAAAGADAQTFSSGSTGADGPLDLSTCSTSVCGIQLPESGVLNYTTVNVPIEKTLRFKPNLRNTPAVILAQGAVTISGVVDVSRAFTDAQGPGGFAGGSPISGQNGFGPGGGNAADPHGRWVGPLSLVPIIGGSGGKGAGGGCPGTSGGGAVVIASSTSITVNGQVTAIANGLGGSSCGGSGFGSGGAIRLVANSISVPGNLSATSAHHGVIRVEAPAGALSFTGTSTPTAVLSTTINPAILADTTTPSLSITSIAGFAVPSYTTARPDTVDLLLPSQLTDPLSVVVQGRNIPVGTQVSISVTGSSSTITPVALSGSLVSSTATLSVSGLGRAAVSTLYVFATFSASSGAGIAEALNPQGPDHVANVRVEAAPAAKPRFVFLRANGTVIDGSRLPQALLRQFGR